MTQSNCNRGLDCLPDDGGDDDGDADSDDNGDEDVDDDDVGDDQESDDGCLPGHGGKCAFILDPLAVWEC